MNRALIGLKTVSFPDFRNMNTRKTYRPVADLPMARIRGSSGLGSAMTAGVPQRTASMSSFVTPCLPQLMQHRQSSLRRFVKYFQKRLGGTRWTTLALLPIPNGLQRHIDAVGELSLAEP